MTLLRNLVLAFAILCGLAPAQAQSVDYDALDARLERLVELDDMAGLAVAVIEQGEIRFAKGYGVTRVDGGAPVTEETVFRWASLSKGVAASVTMKLVGDGKISLQDTVSKFGASLRLPGGGENKATVENLLSHMLGVVPNAYDMRLEDGNDPAGIRKAIGRLKPTCAVGTCHTYQNVAFDAVSEIVEAVTEVPYAETADALLFEPLGMKTASLTRGDLQASASWAEPHVKRKGRDMERRIVKDAYYNVPAAGGVNGSILDLARYAQAQMGLAPEVLDAATLEEMHRPRVYTRREQSRMSRLYSGELTDARYALGWRSYKYATGARVVGHRGAVEGYRSLILFDPERDSGVVVLWNSNASAPVGVQFEVMDQIYGLPAQDWIGLDKKEEGAG